MSALCPICSKELSRKDAVTRHLASVHNQSPQAASSVPPPPPPTTTTTTTARTTPPPPQRLVTVTPDYPKGRVSGGTYWDVADRLKLQARAEEERKDLLRAQAEEARGFAIPAPVETPRDPSHRGLLLRWADERRGKPAPKAPSAVSAVSGEGNGHSEAPESPRARPRQGLTMFTTLTGSHSTTRPVFGGWASKKVQFWRDED
jgi:hypothetical protein